MKQHRKNGMRKQQTIVERLCSEVILYGGMPLSRGDVYTICLEDTGNKRCADYFAFHPRSVQMAPMTVAAFRQKQEETTA